MAAKWIPVQYLGSNCIIRLDVIWFLNLLLLLLHHLLPQLLLDAPCLLPNLSDITVQFGCLRLISITLNGDPVPEAFGESHYEISMFLEYTNLDQHHWCIHISFLLD